MTKQYELVFWGSGTVNYMPRYRRMHESIESARAAALAVWRKLQARGLPTACHTPIVYGPGCGADGTTVQPW